MMVDTTTATGGRIVHQSEELYFCSDTCRRSFEAEPEKFIPERHEPPYTVEDGMTAPKFGSAASGGLEYEPLPERHDEPSRRRKK
jgi:YHS domain-containing protein